MILVLTGTTHYPFLRLIRKAIEIRNTRFTHEVLYIQTPNLRTRERLPLKKGDVVVNKMPLVLLKRKARSAKIIICHCGFGSVALANAVGKIPYVLPRSAELGEHISDHQKQLCRMFLRQNRVLPLSKAGADKRTTTHFVYSGKSRPNKLISYLINHY